MKNNMRLNLILAEKSGWTNICHVNGALLGTPPDGYPSCRGQAVVPNWTGDNAAAFNLMCAQLAMDPGQVRIEIVRRSIETHTGKKSPNKVESVDRYPQ